MQLTLVSKKQRQTCPYSQIDPKSMLYEKYNFVYATLGSTMLPYDLVKLKDR